MRKLDYSQISKQTTALIKSSVAAAKFQQVVVALSGGVDSATACFLAVKALGKENVYVLLLPYKNWHEQGLENAQTVIKQLAIPEKNIVQVDITSMVEIFKQELGIKNQELSKNHIRVGNIMARVRMIIIYDLAKKLSALVLGTENKTEHLLGYYTRFGDEASDIEPLRTLYKTEVWQLAEYLGVPDVIINQAPSAGLWSGQTDEGEFGFSYQQADEILYWLKDKGLSVKDLVNQGLDKEVVKKVVSWLEKTKFKHQVPILAPEPAEDNAFNEDHEALAAPNYRKRLFKHENLKKRYSSQEAKKIIGIKT